MTADLVARLAAGTDHPREDFEDLLQPLLRPALHLACTMLRDRHEAEDAVQEAALNAWRKLHQFQDQGSGMQPWFLTIVANRCKARLRSRWWHVWRRSDVERSTSGGYETGAVFRADLARALDRLTSEQRTVLFLFYQLDLPQDEVARILGIGVGAVKSRLHRAVRQLRSALDVQETPHDL